MEKLEELLKNKKILITTCIAVIIIAVAIVIIIEYNQNKSGQTIELLEKMEGEITNKQETTENTIQENQAQKNSIIEEIVEQEKIAVHITGEVKKKGILYLEVGARIADAIGAAGGTTKEANLDAVNLAYVLEDGQKIYIPNKKEKLEQGAYIIKNSGQNVLVEQGKNSTKTENNEKGEIKKVNINQANQTELENLPGVGPSLAQRIIEYRESNGSFKKIEEIQNVKGIGDSKYSNMKEYICIE